MAEEVNIDPLEDSLLKNYFNGVSELREQLDFGEDPSELSWLRTMRHLCRFNHLPLTPEEVAGHSACPADYDGKRCWPPTRPGEYAVVPCLEYLGTNQDKVQQWTSRFCWENSTWAMAELQSCSVLPPMKQGAEEILIGWHGHAMLWIYWIGNTVSILLLVSALWIFAHYKNLRCLRNKIHTHLFLCYTLFNLLWVVWAMIGYATNFKGHLKHTSAMTSVISLILKYLLLSSFFWLGIEGVYLVMLVMLSFKKDILKHWMCVFIGWGLPLLPLALSIAVNMGRDQSTQCFGKLCLYDYPTLVPIFFILISNLMVLCVLLTVIHKKVDFLPQFSVQHKTRRTIRAMFILCPVMGCHYLLVVLIPDKPIWLWIVFAYMLTVVQSFQGAIVAISFCFLNADVRRALKLSAVRLKTRFDTNREVNQRLTSSNTDNFFVVAFRDSISSLRRSSQMSLGWPSVSFDQIRLLRRMSLTNNQNSNRNLRSLALRRWSEQLNDSDNNKPKSLDPRKLIAQNSTEFMPILFEEPRFCPIVTNEEW